MTEPKETVDEVLAKLGVDPTGDIVEDLVRGMMASRALRENNSRWGGILIDAAKQHMSWRDLHARTGITRAKALGWSKPPL